MTTPQAVLEFWFGVPGSPEHGKPRDVWFKKSDAFDAAVRERFLPLYETAASDGLSTWEATPQSLLALIIALDQFPRNMFRDNARAYATDAAALAASERMVARGRNLELGPLERWFAYLPYEHAENLVLQRRSLELFGRLAADAGLDEPLAWARKHHDVIYRFGRFPQRNAPLGRESTREEIEFLGQPGSAF
jgi:uncharacterized protein (DUF924 family)